MGMHQGVFMSVNQIQIHVENIKCGGCEKSILRGLASLEGLSDVVIDRDQQLISVTGDPSLREALVAKLRSMGYPEQGSVSGLEAGLTNAKSFVSCAIGRIS
jgi:copper chaperone